MGKARATLVLTIAVAIAGCTADGLRDLQPQGPGPDEFSVLPVKPLTQPQDYQFLPAPTPGGGNITDPNPIEDAVVALGGSATALNASGVPASDQALVTASSRYGVAPNTRQVLAEEDAAFRKRKRRFSSLKLFPVDRYADVYRPQSIDPYEQTKWWRLRGYETPSSPPE